MITLEPDFELLQTVADNLYGGDPDAMATPLHWLEDEVAAGHFRRFGNNCLAAVPNAAFERYATAHPEAIRAVIIGDCRTTVAWGGAAFASYLGGTTMDASSSVRFSSLENVSMTRSTATLSAVANCAGPRALEDVRLEQCQAAYSRLRNIRAVNCSFDHADYVEAADAPMRTVANRRFRYGRELAHPSVARNFTVAELGNDATAEDDVPTVEHG